MFNDALIESHEVISDHRQITVFGYDRQYAVSDG